MASYFLVVLLYTSNRRTLYHIIDIIGSLELWVGLHITLLDEVLKLEP